MSPPAMTPTTGHGSVWISMGYLVLLVAMILPLVWPFAWAFLRRLPRRFVFGASVLVMTVGASTVVITLLVYPLNTYFLFLAPSLQDAGLPFGHWLRAPLSFVTSWTIVWLPLLASTLTLAITHALARRWPAFCALRNS